MEHETSISSVAEKPNVDVTDYTNCQWDW